MTNSTEYINEAIAIVGVGCKLPGELTSIEDLWDVVINKKEVISEIDKNRFDNIDALVNKNRGVGKIVTKRGGFIKDIEYFDANFFQISPKEADKLDPQQRFLLETSFNAIEDAGISLEELDGSKTGVFIGCWLNDYEQKVAQTQHDVDVYSTTGTGRYPLSGRLSFFYNLQGPSISIDTACSSSLVAIHLAMQSLKSGECNLAFAGAANAIVDSFISVGYSRSGLLSEYGACHFGSKNPDGYVRSEGAAVIILKRLSDAIKDNNQIYAILPSSVVNNDGASDKYMLAPSAITQQIMLEEAYRKANINPQDVKFIEGHGTGTKAGDPAEINSIWRALSKNRDLDNKIYIGSVKTNIGHTEGVAGFAGLFKTIMAMKNKTIPPNLHFYEPNPDIEWGKIGVEIPTEAIPWNVEDNEPLIAGVNAFGITGTNAHVVVKSYTNSENELESYQKSFSIFPLSALNPKALTDYANKYIELINSNNFENITKNVAFHKANLQQRQAIVFSNFQELKNGLESIVSNTDDNHRFEGFATLKKPKIAFVFPGQGSQWLGMGINLYQQEPIFKSTIDACELAFSKYVDWKLTDVLFSSDPSNLSEIDVIQPTLVAIEIALAKLWQSMGVQPNAVIGHSMGEIAAAHIAEIITLEDAAKIICTRSLLMKEQKGKGAMGYIALPSTEVQNHLSSFEDKVSIGVINSSKSTVITGDKESVEELIKQFDEQGVFSRLIKVDVASHSQQMDSLKDRLFEATYSININESVIAFQSTVDPEINNSQQIQADYWVDNLRNTVQFSKAIHKLIEDGIDIFIEISPNPVLTQAIYENIEQHQSEAKVLFSLEKNKNDDLSFAEQLATAYCNGVYINWRKFYGANYQKIKLPQYPWQKERYWIEGAKLLANQQNRIHNGKPAHHFLNKYTFDTSQVETHIWESTLQMSDFPFFADHKVGEKLIFPAAAFIEIVHAVCAEVKSTSTYTVEHLTIHEALEWIEDKPISLKIILQNDIGNLYQLTIQSLQDDEMISHLTTNIIFRNLPEQPPFIENAMSSSISKDEHYTHCQSIELNYGTDFQTVQLILHNQSIFESKVELPADVVDDSFIFHPSLLDGCLQTILAPIYLQSQSTFVPHTIGTYCLYQAPNTHSLKTKVVVKTINDEKCICDISIYSDSTLFVNAENVEFAVINKKSTATKAPELFYELTSIPSSIQVSDSNPIIFLGNSENSEIVDKIAQRFISNNREILGIDILSYSKAYFLKAFSQLSIKAQTQVVFVLNTDVDWEDEDSILYFQQKSVLAISSLVQAISELNLSVRLWCITQNGIKVNDTQKLSPLHHQVVAFMRVLWNENIELKPSIIDLDESSNYELLPNLIAQNNSENEIAIRNNQCFVTRLAQKQTLNHKTKISTDLPFVFEMEQIGVIDNLVPRVHHFPMPKPHEVLVDIKSIGVNFMSLLSVLGICPGKDDGFCTLGIECVGIVQSVGSDVQHLKIGDVVYGMAYDTLASHTLVDANAMCKVPSGFSYDELATIPAVFLTVYYSLIELARIKKGDKVLVHAATGGVGLAAIQLCKLYNCEIFATAGNEDKRAYLKSIGIEHVYNSRTLDFYDEILKDTDNKGVDIVLNSLTGEAMYKSLSLLSDFGKFIEIGKKDIYENSKIGLEVFQKSLSYFMVDAQKMLFEKPEVLGELLIDISAMLEEGKIQPLPLKTFDVSESKAAFNYLNTSKHIGKIVINLENKNKLEIQENASFAIDDNGTYLLTGGLGGLGLQFTKFLVEQGAKNIILLGRSAPSESVNQLLESYRNNGVNIITYQADVSNKKHLQIVLSRIDETTSLKGVFHLAGLLDDASVLNITDENYFNVLFPKVYGALYLHELTKSYNLDYFVLFSSSAVLFASPGQGAYVASNAFLDALAQQRKLENKPALSIQWSTIADVGLAAQSDNRSNRLQDEGIEPLLAKETTEIFKEISTIKEANIGVFKFDVNKWKHHYTTAKDNPYFSLLGEVSTEPIVSLSYLNELKQIHDKQELEHTLEEKIKATVSKVTKISSDKISSLSTFKSLGIDSLMSIQLKNQLEQIFETKLSVTAFWTYSTLKAYAKFLIEKLDLLKEEAITKVELKAPISEISSPDIIEPVIIKEQPEVKVDEPENISTHIDNNAETTQPTEDEKALEDLSKLLDDELKDLL